MTDVKEQSGSPLDIRAEAIALMCLGHSARTVEKMLHAKYPSAKVPRYSTISRWLTKPSVERYLKRSVRVRWSLATAQAGEILGERIDELQHAPLMQLVKAYDRITEIYLRNRGL